MRFADGGRSASGPLVLGFGKPSGLSAQKGKTVTVKFTMSEDSSLQTSFVVDDTALTVG